MFIEQREMEIDKWYFGLTSYKLHNYGEKQIIINAL